MIEQKPFYLQFPPVVNKTVVSIYQSFMNAGETGYFSAFELFPATSKAASRKNDLIHSFGLHNLSYQIKQSAPSDFIKQPFIGIERKPNEKCLAYHVIVRHKPPKARVL